METLVEIGLCFHFEEFKFRIKNTTQFKMKKMGLYKQNGLSLLR